MKNNSQLETAAAATFENKDKLILIEREDFYWAHFAVEDYYSQLSTFYGYGVGTLLQHLWDQGYTNIKTNYK